MTELTVIDLSLTLHAGNDVEFIELAFPLSEIEELKKSQSRLAKVIKLLDIYEQLIDAHIESKATIFRYAVVKGVSIRRDVTFRTIRNDVNRNVFNTLNIGKLLLDKLCYSSNNNLQRTFVHDLWNDEQKHDRFLEKREIVFQKNINYVLGCYLRNYAQHNSVVTSTIHTGTYQQKDKPEIVKYLSSTIERELLSKLTSEVRARSPEVIELPATLDGYVDGISEMYTHMIGLIRDLVSTDIQTIRSFAEHVVNKSGLEILDGSFIVELTGGSYDFAINSSLCKTISDTIAATIYPTRFQETTFSNIKKSSEH